MNNAIATMYWGAVLQNPEGLVVASDWEIDFARVSPDAFQAAYEPFVEALKAAEVPQSILDRLAFDPASIKAITHSGRKDTTFRQALRYLGLTLRDQISKHSYQRAIQGRQPSKTKDGAPAQVQLALDGTDSQLAQKIEVENPTLYKTVKPKLRKFNNSIVNLEQALQNVALGRDLALGEQALLYLIDGLFLKNWRLFYTVLENLMLNRVTLFTRAHIHKLQSLPSKIRGEERRGYIDYLLTVLQRRRTDLFPMEKK